MKKLIIVLFLFSLSTEIHAQENDQSKLKIYADIFQNGTQAQKDSLTKVFIKEGKVSKKEEELELYFNYLTSLKLTAEAKKIQDRAIKLNPKGKMARGKDITHYYALEKLSEKEKLYTKILSKYPMDKYPGDGIVYDYVTSALAVDMIKAGQKEKSLQYLNNLQEEFWRSQGYIPVAIELLKAGDTISAIPLIRQSMEDALKFIRGDVQDNKAKFAGVGYPGYVQMYADVLLAKGESEEALRIIAEARAVVPNRAAEFRPAYARALQMAGRDLEAFNQYTSLYSEGQFNYYTPLQDLYVKLNNGQNSGFDQFIEQQKITLKENIVKELKKTEIEKESPSFKLRDFEGKMVELNSLKGKIVVLDFWATWCQPCIKSFPGMQKAVTHYSNDPNVVFLFIDTWERAEEYEQLVKDFITKNNYTFHVLFDDGKTDTDVAPKFGVKGIPAKFIIDQKGKIRFSLTGSSPYADYILMELIEMIEYVRES